MICDLLSFFFMDRAGYDYANLAGLQEDRTSNRLLQSIAWFHNGFKVGLSKFLFNKTPMDIALHRKLRCRNTCKILLAVNFCYNDWNVGPVFIICVLSPPT